MAEFEPIRLPLGRWSPDEHFLAAETGELDDIRDVVYEGRAWHRVRQVGNITELNAVYPGRPTSALSWSDEGGNNRFCVGFTADAGGVSKLLVGDLVGGGMADRSKVGGYTAGAEWSLVKFGAAVIATNGSDPVQLLNFSAASADLITSTTKPRGRYLCACRGHVILLSISSPVSNRRQFRWSALNDAANWEPGSNRSGFSELPSDAGVITGAAGFEDFFLIFTTVGVYRASYIGGEQVWALQQIGGWYDGLPNQFYNSIVTVERDAYYIGRTGPKVVANGEAVRDLGDGKFRRFLLDLSRNSLGGSEADTTIAYGDWVWGAYDGFRKVVYWAWQVENTLDRAPDIYRQLWVHPYSIDDDTLSLILPIEDQFSANPNWEINYGPLMARPGNLSMFGATVEIPWGLCFFRTELGSLVNFVAAYGFGVTTTAYLNSLFVTKTWRPSASQTQIHAVRPLARFVGDVLKVDPKISVTIRPSNGTPVTLTQGSTAEDARGFLHPPSPISAAEFVFDVTIVDTGGADPTFLRDLIGLELLVTSQKSTRGGNP